MKPNLNELESRDVPTNLNTFFDVGGVVHIGETGPDGSVTMQIVPLGDPALPQQAQDHPDEYMGNPALPYVVYTDPQGIVLIGHTDAFVAGVEFTYNYVPPQTGTTGTSGTTATGTTATTGTSATSGGSVQGGRAAGGGLYTVDGGIHVGGKHHHAKHHGKHHGHHGKHHGHAKTQHLDRHK